MIIEGFAPYHIGYNELLMNISSTIIFSTLGQSGCTKKRLSEIIEKPQYGFTATSAKEPFGTKIVRITDIQKGTLDWSTVPYCECENSDQYLLKENDILFARSGSIGKSCIIKSPEESIFASYLIRVRAKLNINPDFLFWFFQSKQYWTQILSKKIGSAQPNFNGQKLISLEICVPDISVQNSIAEFLAAYQRKLLNESHEIPKLPSILHSVDKKVATLERLIAKIEEARRQRAKAIDKAEALVISEARHIFEKMKISPTPLSRWVDNSRGGIQTGPFGAQLGTSDFQDTGHPLITIGNVQFGGLKLEGLRFVSEEKAKQLERYTVTKGDIIFARMGTVGRCCVVPEEVQGWLFNYHIIRVAPDQQRINPRYLHWIIQASPDIEAYLEEKIRGATRQGVNTKIVSGLPCRVPSLPEQCRIVADIDRFQAKVDEVKRLQVETEREMEALVPAVLAKAFGEGIG